MALIKEVLGIAPKFGKDIFLAQNATIVGQVEMGDFCSVWFNAVIRGDVNFIKIGNKVNIHDGAVIHCSYKKHATIIGDNVSVGHNAIVHGCTVKDNVLVGMGAIIMDNVVVESNTIIGAGSVVLENSVLESGCIYAGVPAKKVKTLSQEQTKVLIEGIADNYLKYSEWFKE